MKTLLLSVKVVVLGILVGACGNKDKDPTPNTNPQDTTKTAKDLIIGSWSKVKTTMREEGSNVDSTFTPSECTKDDLDIYQADGKYVKDWGLVKCDPGETRFRTDNYALSADGKTLTYTYVDGSGSLEFTVVELTSTKLVLRLEYDGDVTTVEYKKI